MSGQHRISHRAEGARLLGEDWTVIEELGELIQASLFLFYPMATEGTNICVLLVKVAESLTANKAPWPYLISATCAVVHSII